MGLRFSHYFKCVVCKMKIQEALLLSLIFHHLFSHFAIHAFNHLTSLQLLPCSRVLTCSRVLRGKRAGCNGPWGSVAVRSYPSPKVIGSDPERQAATAQERWPRGASPRPRSGAAAERSCSTFKVRRGGREKIPLVHAKEQRLRFAGAAVKRYPTSEVRETQVRRLGLQEGTRGQTLNTGPQSCLTQWN